MANLLNIPATLMRPSTSGTTGAFLQNKPEDSEELAGTLASVQAEPVAPTAPAAPSVSTEPVAAPVTETTAVPEPEVTSPVDEQAAYENELDVNLEALLKEQATAEERAKLKVSGGKSLMDKNLEALEKGQEPVDLDEELSWGDIAEDTFWAGARGFNQGVGFMLDLVPGGVLQAAELVDNYFLDDKIDTSKYQHVVQRAMNDRWGTVDSYKKGAVSEVAADVAQAAPLTISVAGSLARYGVGQMLNSGVLNQYAAPYALRFSQSLGIDMAAVTAGEVAEEITEEYTSEGSGWGTAANLGSAIFAGTAIQRVLQPNTALQEQATERGVKILGSGSNETGSSAAIARDTITQFLTQNAVSKTLFKNFSDQSGDMSAYAAEVRAMGKSGKAFLREVWNKQMTDDDRAQFFANMELASQMGLKLTPYELMGQEKLRPLALATARITPDTTLKRIDENLEALDKWIAKDAPDISEAKRDLLKGSLSAHNKTIDQTVEHVRQSLVKRKQDLLEDLAEREMADSPADIGERFRNAVTSYTANTTSIFSKLFDDAVDKEIAVNPKVFTKELKDGLDFLGKGTFTLSKKAGATVSDLIKAASPQATDTGSTYTKVTVGDLMEARNSVNKALMGLDRETPMFVQQRESLTAARDAIDSTLGSVLPQEQQAALKQARMDWRDNVAIKFGSKEASKLTTLDNFNNPFYNGQEMLEVVFHGSDKETRARAYADFLKVTADGLSKFTDPDKANVVVNAAEAAKLSLKQYVVNQMISDVALRKDTPVEEVIQSYMQRNQAVFSEILDEVDFDPGKMFRDVEKGLSDLQKAESDLLAKRLFLGGSEDSGVFDLKTYLQKHVLENKPEADRLVRLLNSPDELANLGYTKEAVQEMFSSTLIRDIVGESTDGRVLDSNLKKLLDKAPAKLEELIGTERVEHLRKFLVGHNLSTKFTPSEVTPRGAANLDKSMAQDLGLGMVPAFISDRMIIAKRMASAEYIMALRAVKIIGGLKSDGYRGYMTKVMTDPKFFLEAVKWDPKSYGDVKRLRLYLAAQGIDTSVLNNEQAQQQANNLEMLNAETEGSPHDNDQTRQAIINDITGMNAIREGAEQEFRTKAPELLQRPEAQLDVSPEAMKAADSNDPMHEVDNLEGPIVDDMSPDEATKTKATFKFHDLRSQGIPKEQVLKILEASGMGDNNNKSLILSALDEAYGSGE